MVGCDKELISILKVAPPMLDRFTNGQSFQIIGGVSVSTLSEI
jgi:hypothetical protein